MACRQQRSRPPQQAQAQAQEGQEGGAQVACGAQKAGKGTGAQPKCSCECVCGARKPSRGLFVDEDFPARWNLLHNPSVAVAWLRPHELRESPRLFVEGTSRCAVQQGCLGDSWLIAACAAVAERPDLLKMVVPTDQVLFGPGYDGSVTFRLWHLGEWQDVRIDDRIPVDRNGLPVYARCRNKDEFWLPLLEKAFAKFHGSYAFLHQDHGDSLGEALLNLTGHCITTDEVRKWDLRIDFETLKYVSDMNALIVCNTENPGPGLPGWHAYTVTKVYHLKDKEDKAKDMKMVRVRNPWGTEVEWAGAWKDGDERWNTLSEEIKEAMEYKPENDGEFWMDLHDFCENFFEICYATLTPLEGSKMKMVAQIAGAWSDNIHCGGSPNDIEKFAKNPQFLLVALGIKEEEKDKKKDKSKRKSSEDDDYDDDYDYCDPLAGVEAVIELVQEHISAKRNWRHKMCYYVFETCAEHRLSAQQMLDITYVVGATHLMEDSAVRSVVRLHPGRRYLIVPTTSSAGQSGDFLIRVYSRRARVHLSELPE